MARRSFVLTLLLSVGLLCTATAQNNATFTVKNSPTTFPNDTPITVDLNGDGIPDLVEVLTTSPTGIPAPNAFTVQLGKGDGTFGAPVDYPPGVNGWVGQIDSGIATADFNNDGKADIVVPITTQNGSTFETKLQFYMGNGDGTLATPVSTTVPDAVGGILAADFNQDGKVDLVIYEEEARTVEFLAGDGHGNFSDPTPVFVLASNQDAGGFRLGDFDADGHADVAFVVANCPCQSGFVSSSEVHILYGSGTGSFTHQLAYVDNSSNGLAHFTSGQVNGDGPTDLVFGFGNGVQDIVILYGSNTRTPTKTTFNAGISPASNSGQPIMFIADLNGDLHNDFGFWAVKRVNTSYQTILQIFLGNTNGTFKSEQLTLANDGIGTFATGDYNRDRRPDVVAPFFTQGAQTTGTNTAKAFLDTTTGGHFDGCAFPASSHAIHVCGPTNGTTVTSPMKFTAAGNWFQTLRKSELWIDGVKVAEQHFGWDKSQWFEQRRQLAPGSHKATFFTAGYDNQLQKQSVTFTVSGTQSCSHPGSPGVHVCSPLSGSIWGGSVLGQAAATVSGTPSRMELWVDGVKTFSQSGSTMNAGMNLKPGLHRFTFFAFNMTGGKWSSSTTATVQ